MMSLDAVWTPFDIEIQVGADAATYSSTATVGNAYEMIVALVAWANNAARPWTGTITFAWSWTRDTATGGAFIVLSADVAFDINITAGGLYMPNGAAQTTYTGTDPATGTWAPSIPIAVRGHVRLLGDGDMGGTERLIRPGVPSIAGIKPHIDALGTALDACRLAGVLAGATNPRRVWVYQLHRSTWRNYALGAVDRSPEGMTAYRFTLDVAGEAI